MNNEQLKDILMAKIEQEFSIYKQDLIKNCTKEEIIDKSYEINFKEETLSILEGATLSFKEIKALLSTEKVLGKMYNKYMNIETEETLQKVVKIKANSLNEAINIAKEKYSNEEYILDYQDYKGTEFREYKDEIVKEKKVKNRESR